MMSILLSSSSTPSLDRNSKTNLLLLNYHLITFLLPGIFCVSVSLAIHLVSNSCCFENEIISLDVRCSDGDYVQDRPFLFCLN